jgi:hypothetical protein
MGSKIIIGYGGSAHLSVEKRFAAKNMGRIGIIILSPTITSLMDNLSKW